MKLYIDVGNSRIKWCDDAMLVDGAYHAIYKDKPDELIDAQSAKPGEVWISSVADEEYNRQLVRLIGQNWEIQPTFVRTQAAHLGVINGYRKHSQLGVDRWTALIAAYTLFKPPMIVVDCGSATTIDAIRADGQHLGGLILPGVTMMQQTLMNNTAMDDTADSGQLADFAQDTAAGIRSAAIQSTAALIESSASRLKQRLKQEVACVITGGNAEVILERLVIPADHQPNLVLKGMALAASETTNP